MQIDPLSAADATDVVITTQDAYRHALVRITELEAALRSIYAAADAATCADDWVERISAVMTDDIRALIFKD